MIRILLVAADKEMVARHLEAVTQAGLRPVGVDLNAFAVMRAVAPDPETAEGSEMIVDVGAGVTNVVVHQQGKPRFVRILVLGGDDITQGVVSSLGVSEKDAETTKHREGLGGHSESADAIEQRVDEFVDEMRGSLDYYLAQSGSSQVRRLLISGGGSKLSGLRDRLADTLRIPVESSTPMRHLPVADTAYSQEQLDEIQPVLVTAIGLALGGLQ